MIKSIIYILKRVIIGFLIGVLLFLFKTNFALAVTKDGDSWIYNMEGASGFLFLNWSSDTNYTELGSSYFTTPYWALFEYGYTPPSSGDIHEVWTHTQVGRLNPMNLGSFGISVGVKTSHYFYKNRLYNASIYIHTDKPINRYDTSSFMIGRPTIGDQVYSAYTSSSIKCPSNYDSSNVPDSTWEGYCYQLSGIVQPAYSGYNLYARITSTQSTSVTILGYTTEFIGDINSVTKQDLTNAITNSGFATASSVNQVQQSVNQVKQEIQGMQQQQQQTNQKLDELNNNITSEDIDTSGYAGLSNNNANNGVINQLVTMPITLAQSYLNGFNSSCTPFSLGTLYGEELILPCINPQNYLGGIWNVIDVIISGIFIFIFGKRLVKIFNDVTNLKENQVNEVFD